VRDDAFNTLAQLVRDRSGLALDRDKEYLLETRLASVARKHNLASVEALAGALRGAPRADVVRDVVEAMTTNESFFFRDVGAFKTLRETILPRLIAARAARRELRIWCAACSSGQEPYSIAMILDEYRDRFAGWRVDLLATDLSTEMIGRCHSGLYSHFEVQRGLPVQYLTKFFKKEGDGWAIAPALRKAVEFRPFNLLDEPAGFGTFDIILCRNVLIYFDIDDKAKILDRLARHLAGDGALFLGGAETVLGITETLVPRADLAGVFVPAPRRIAISV
jgi:chemotaxis protein methyltransferase CheR